MRKQAIRVVELRRAFLLRHNQHDLDPDIEH